MRDYFGGVGAAESLGFSVSDAALIIKDILLHYPCVSFIASKKILDNSSVQATFWKAAVADGVFGKVFFGQDLFDPGIDGEGVDVVESEEADTVVSAVMASSGGRAARDSKDTVPARTSWMSRWMYLAR